MVVAVVVVVTMIKMMMCRQRDGVIHGVQRLCEAADNCYSFSWGWRASRRRTPAVDAADGGTKCRVQRLQRGSQRTDHHWQRVLAHGWAEEEGGAGQQQRLKVASQPIALLRFHILQKLKPCALT